MQTTVRAVISSAAMVRATRPGVLARKAILRDLRRRRGVPATASAVALAVSLSPNTTRHHLATLAAAGLVEMLPERPATYRLTTAGKIATD